MGYPNNLSPGGSREAAVVLVIVLSCVLLPEESLVLLSYEQRGGRVLLWEETTHDNGPMYGSRRARLL